LGCGGTAKKAAHNRRSGTRWRFGWLPSSRQSIRRIREIAMFNSRLWIQTCALFFTCFVFTSPSLARSSFDGAWSVVVVTRAGACTPTLRYPVAITNGIVTNSGDSPASVSGRVAPTGAVRVTVQSGGSWATGSGHLSTTGGSGVLRAKDGLVKPKQVRARTQVWIQRRRLDMAISLHPSCRLPVAYG